MKPIDSARNAEPARISAIMQYSRVAAISESVNVRQVSVRWNARQHQRADDAERGGFGGGRDAG